MASTPSPQCSSLPSRPSNNSKTPGHHHQHRHHNNNPNRRYSSNSPTGNGTSAAGGASGGKAAAGFSSSMSSFLGGARTTGLGPEFSSRRSTRFVSKMYSGRPRASLNKNYHSPVADEVLRCLFKAGNDPSAIDNVLLSFENRLVGVEDYTYMLKEFTNEGSYLLTNRCYES